MTWYTCITRVRMCHKVRTLCKYLVPSTGIQSVNIRYQSIKVPLPLLTYFLFLAAFFYYVFPSVQFPPASCSWLPTSLCLFPLETSIEIINKTHNGEERKSKTLQDIFWISRNILIIQLKRRKIVHLMVINKNWNGN